MNTRSNDTAVASAVDCPACATSSRAVANYASPHNGITYYRHCCPACSLHFWSPLKADNSIYEDAGFPAYRDYHAGNRPFPRWAEPLVSGLTSPSVNALDIGCGDGAVLARLQQLGARVRGIDLDPQSIEIAESRCGPGTCSVSTLADFVTDAARSQEQFDLVSFFEVLEHQVDPKGFLAQVKKLVSRAGTVAGSVPDRDRFLAWIDRRLDTGDLPPHHFLWFSMESLHGLLVRSGYTRISIRRTGRLGLGETFQKTQRMLGSRLERIRGFPGPLANAMACVAAFPLACIYWLGRRRRPSHLYFSCHPDSP